jgi:hypothetical protein
MPRRCTVCSLPPKDCLEVDKALVQRTPYRDIARQYAVSKDALSRHRKEHIPETLLKGHEAREAADGDKLLRHLKSLHGKTIELLQWAEFAQEYGTALRAVREARENLALLAKLFGQLDERPVVNVLVSQEWVATRTAIVVALEPHPEARESVLRALEGVSNGSG